MDNISTFQQTVDIRSTIDYIYLGFSLKNKLTENSIQYINAKWSDHAILHTTITFGNSKLGPGLWRGNSSYASIPDFQFQLKTQLSKTLQTEMSNANKTNQDIWEAIKITTKKCIRSFGIKHVSWRRSALKQMARKRNRLLRSKPPIAILETLLPTLDSMKATLQQELVDVAALKSGIVWREKGEKSAKYRKNIHKQRESQQFMAGLQSTIVDDTVVGSPTPPTLCTDNKSMQMVSQQFYQQLYTVDSVSDALISEYLDSITFDKQHCVKKHKLIGY